MADAKRRGRARRAAGLGDSCLRAASDLVDAVERADPFDLESGVDLVPGARNVSEERTARERRLISRRYERRLTVHSRWILTCPEIPQILRLLSLGPCSTLFLASGALAQGRRDEGIGESRRVNTACTARVLAERTAVFACRPRRLDGVREIA